METPKESLSRIESPPTITLTSNHPIEEVIADVERRLATLEHKELEYKKSGSKYTHVGSIIRVKNELIVLRDLLNDVDGNIILANDLVGATADDIETTIDDILKLSTFSSYFHASYDKSINRLNIEINFVSADERIVRNKVEQEKLAQEAFSDGKIAEVVEDVRRSQLSGKTTRSSSVEFGYRWGSEYLRNKKLENLLKGKNLVDLGTGYNMFGMAQLGQWSKSPEVDLVDVNDISINDLPHNTSETVVKTFTKDMLEFVSKLPSDYGNFSINGIDSNIIAHEKYVDYLVFHLNRCVPSGGIVFGINTWFLNKLEAYGFKDITEDVIGISEDEGRNMLGKIYQKP